MGLCAEPEASIRYIYTASSITMLQAPVENVHWKPHDQISAAERTRTELSVLRKASLLCKLQSLRKELEADVSAESLFCDC